MFYPDWSGINKGCLSNNQKLPPQYMNSRTDLWMNTSLEECCETNHQYILNTCLGISSSSSGFTKWYINFNTWECVQDCDGASPCGGLANSWDVMYDTRQTCCGERKWWNLASCTESPG
ncbi:hypothetical protein ACHAXN_001894 [Cyclotella atomus]